jgi:outer membrane protein TolC
MFSATLGPGSIGSNEVDTGYKLELSQKIPFPGKLRLRGEQAAAEAAAAGSDFEEMRLQLIESARNAYYDYYLAARALEVNEENLKRLNEARENAEPRVRTGLAPQQDLLQVSVEIARQQERELQLRRMQQVAIARINTLLHLPPDHPLAAPPARLLGGGPLPDVAELRARAQGSRPDVQALANRLAADEAALRLAQREFYPDLEAFGAYDAFWQEKPLRSMVGVNVNVPIRLSRRHSAATEAPARVAQRSAQLARLIDQVNFQVHEAYEQVRESENIVRLYENTMVRAAEPNVKEALAAYGTGKVPFLSLIEAQRNLIAVRDRYFESLADYYRRLATLERVVAGPVR